MTMDEIISKHQDLSKKLYVALSTMERKDTIFQMKKEMLDLQKMCPHKDSNYDWSPVNGYCPYCGKKIY